MQDSIVITGLGAVSPIGSGVDAFWEGLRSGKSGAGVVPVAAEENLSRTIACRVAESFGDQPSPGRASSLALAATTEALDSAGLGGPSLADRNTTVVVGTTMGETEPIESRLSASESDWLSHEHLQKVAASGPGSISAHLRRVLNTSGRCWDLYGACAAGNMAIAAAAQALLDGTCDLALAGGADGFSRLAFLGFMRLRVMSEGICRPFDEKRDGLLVGEGAGMFVMERESDARKRGAEIRARVAGWANTCESYHPTRPDPQGDGLSRAVRRAIKLAGLEPGDVDYVCAHGTGTPQNDMIEVGVMREVFPSGVPFSSIKALTGHTMGAAAALEAACCVLTLDRQTLVPTWTLQTPIDCGALEPLTGEVRSSTVRRVVNNSAGFGGYNSSVVLEAA